MDRQGSQTLLGDRIAALSALLRELALPSNLLSLLLAHASAVAADALHYARVLLARVKA